MTRPGVSVVEVILAVSLFAILGTGAVIAVLSGLNSNQSSAEHTVAAQYASEGLEAARSIKNQAFSSLSASSCTAGTGLALSGNNWVFSGSNNQSDKYTRTIYVCDVARDASGNIVPAGTPDPNAKKITSHVTWNPNYARAASVTQTTYLTNWSSPIGSGTPVGALLVYGPGVNPVAYRAYDPAANTFSAAAGFPSGLTGSGFSLEISPRTTEAVLTYQNGSSVYTWCYDGSAWSLEWSAATVSDLGVVPAAVSYETSSGDVMVLYSTGAGGANALAFRTKAGDTGCGSANWTTAQNFPASPPQTTDQVQWVKLARDRRPSSDIIGAAWADNTRRLGAYLWSGSAWYHSPSGSLSTNLERASSPTFQDTDSFDIEFETQSGEPLVVWGDQSGSNGTNGVRFTVCNYTGGTCSWSAPAAPPVFADDATHVDISASPADNQILFASIGNAGNDLQVGRWDGTAWSNIANKDAATAPAAAGRKLVATGWLVDEITGAVRGIVSYNDAQNPSAVHYLTMTPGTPPSWSNTLTFSPSPSLNNNPRGWYDLKADPDNPYQLLLVFSDSSSSLWAKRLRLSNSLYSWSDTEGGSSLGTLYRSYASPFAHSFW